jgi:hypothetical protein
MASVLSPSSPLHKNCPCRRIWWFFSFNTRQIVDRLCFGKDKVTYYLTRVFYCYLTTVKFKCAAQPTVPATQPPVPLILLNPHLHLPEVSIDSDQFTDNYDAAQSWMGGASNFSGLSISIFNQSGYQFELV